jgi:hypothetical protein
MNRFRLFALFSVIVFLVPTGLFAQTSDLRLVTSPLPINISAKPGAEATAQIKLKNDGSLEERLKVSLMKFAAYGESGAPRILEPEPGDEYFSWVSFPEKEFVVGPGEWKTVPMKISLPESAAFGYYYAVVFSRAGDAPETQPGQTALTGGTAVLVLLDAEVPGAKREANVVSFSTDHTVYEFLPSKFMIRLQNTGNVHLAPRGNIFVGRPGEQDASIIEVNPEKGNILPESYREYMASWNEGFPSYKDKIEDGKVVRDAKGNIVQELSWNLGDIAKVRFGKYQAKLLMVYDDGQRDVPIEGTVDFWVIPWRIILAALVVLGLILLGLRSTLGGIWRKVSKKK